MDWLDLFAGTWRVSKGLSRVFSNTTVQKQQFFSSQLSFFFFFFFKFYFIFKLYIIVLVLPNIKMNPPFFIVHLSHPYMTSGKTKALTRRTFVGKVMALLFNMLSRLVITFLPRSKRLLISWLQSPSAVIWCYC